MKIYDISQEVFTCCVYPGDPAPEREVLCSMEEGALYNLTALRMCAHNGTHVDAPRHFLRDGRTIDQMALEAFVGPVYVAHHDGDVTAGDARCMLENGAAQLGHTVQRLLIAGNAVVTQEAAEIFARAGLLLLGNESQSVGPENAPMAVHKTLLGAGTALLEGIRLANVPKGVYLLSAAPLNLGGTEGAPCRAVLIELPQGGMN